MIIRSFSALLCKSKGSDSSIATIMTEKSNEIPVKEIVNNPSPPSIPQKSFKTRKRFFASLLSLSMILLCTLTAFLIIQSNSYRQKLQVNEKIIQTQQGKDARLLNELNILNSRINQTQKQLITELNQQNSLVKHLNHSRIIDNQTITNLLTQHRHSLEEQRKSNETIIELRHLRLKDNSTMQELFNEQKLQHQRNEMLTNQLKQFSQGEESNTRMIQELHHLRLKYNQTKEQWIIESQQASKEQKRLKDEIIKLQSLRAKDRDTLLELRETVDKFNRSDENHTKSPHIQIKSTTQWNQHGTSVAKRTAEGNDESLGRPCTVRIDDEGMMIIVDCSKHCLWEWTVGALNGNRIAGGTERGNGDNELKYPTDVIIDQMEKKLIICDRDNRRVVRWPRRNGRKGETIIFDVKCFGLAMDMDRFLYVSDIENHEVRRWKIGESTSKLIAGGKPHGSGLHQLNKPHYIFITPDLTLFISDWENHRVMKWTKNASEGIVVFSRYGDRNGLFQLSWPEGIFVDQSNSVYIADCPNNRVLRLVKGGVRASSIAGRYLQGNGTDQFYCPQGFAFDSRGNLYVADTSNYRVQKFDVERL